MDKFYKKILFFNYQLPFHSMIQFAIFKLCKDRLIEEQKLEIENSKNSSKEEFFAILNPESQEEV